jgi:hypothetical protein
MRMQKVLFYFVLFFLSVQAFAQRTTEPVKNWSNKIIAIFPDTLSEAQIYQEVGKALVQQGYNIDSREQSFGLLLATIHVDRGGYVFQDTTNLRVTVIRHEVAVTGSYPVSGDVRRLEYNATWYDTRTRWDRVMKVFNKLPVVRMEYEVVQL